MAKEVKLYNVGKRVITYLDKDNNPCALKAGKSAEMPKEEADKLKKLYKKEISDSQAIEGDTVKALRVEIKAKDAKISELEAELEEAMAEVVKLTPAK